MPALLSPALRTTLGAYKIRVKKMRETVALPSFFYPCQPVAQLFINDRRIQTRYAFANIHSFMVPRHADRIRVEIELFDAQGAAVTRLRIPIGKFGASPVRMQEFYRSALPELGMISARLCLPNRMSNPYAHLGNVMTHFYTLFHSPDLSSMALVHHQTRFNMPAVPQQESKSNLLVATEKLKGLEVYQINPTRESVKTELYLATLQNKTIVADHAVMPPYGTRRITWPKSLFAAEPYVYLGAHGMTAENAKPLLFNVFSDGSFTACHS